MQISSFVERFQGWVVFAVSGGDREHFGEEFCSVSSTWCSGRCYFDGWHGVVFFLNSKSMFKIKVIQMIPNGSKCCCFGLSVLFWSWDVRISAPVSLDHEITERRSQVTALSSRPSKRRNSKKATRRRPLCFGIEIDLFGKGSKLIEKKGHKVHLGSKMLKGFLCFFG